MSEVGRKDDTGKAPLYRLAIVAKALGDVARVLHYGAEKYPSADNWRAVEGAATRYPSAALRHIMAHLNGEVTDPESGLPHLAHAICSLLFAAELTLPFVRREARPVPLPALRRPKAGDTVRFMERPWRVVYVKGEIYELCDVAGIYASAVLADLS